MAGLEEHADSDRYRLNQKSPLEPSSTMTAEFELTTNSCGYSRPRRKPRAMALVRRPSDRESATSVSGASNRWAPTPCASCSPTVTIADSSPGIFCAISASTGRTHCGPSTQLLEPAALPRDIDTTSRPQPRVAAAIPLSHGRRKTHFGYQTVAEGKKANASLTRVRFGRRSPRPHERPDVRWPAPGVKGFHHPAPGSGRVPASWMSPEKPGSAPAFAKRVGKSGQVWLTDINAAMLAQGTGIASRQRVT